MNMCIAGVAGLYVLLAGFLFAQPAAKIATTMTLSARFEVATVRAGDPAVLLVFGQNRTDKAYVTFLTHPAFDYEFVVRSETGDEVPLTAWGKFLAAKKATRRNIRTPIAPGETFEEKVVLNELYEMKRAGKYTVTAKRRFYNQAGIEKGLRKAEYIDPVTNAATVEVVS